MSRYFLVILFSQIFIVSLSTYAHANLTEFLTSRDLLNNESVSNISLLNNKNSSVTVFGLYVSQYAYVPVGQSCNNATIIYPVTNNITAGAFVMPTIINPGRKAAVGSNYLYNMIYEAIYYENIIIPSSPPGCALPGCTWGSDTILYNWCIYLGALAPVSTSSGYTANIPPSTDSASTTGLYDYNLINNYIYLGPISCNDRTFTCSTSMQQIQTIF
jgi:hypothetical protein